MRNVLLIPSCQIGPGFNQLGRSDTLLRLRRGLELWHAGGYDVVLVTGGIFNPWIVQTVSAAELMQEWLTTRGMPKNLVLCETASLDTYENAAFGLNVLRSAGYGDVRITVVTQWQHAIRFWLTFLLAHGTRVRLVPMRYPVSFLTFTMECVFILHHVLFPTGKWSPFMAWNRSRRKN